MMKTARLVFRALIAIFFLLYGCFLLIRVGVRDKVELVDYHVRDKVGKLVDYHNAMVDSCGAAMEIVQFNPRLGPAGRVQGMEAPDLERLVVEMNRDFAVFNRKVQRFNSSGLPADVKSRFIDVQTTVASMAERINKAATVDRAKFSSESYALEWFDEWDELTDVYEKKLHDLTKVSEKYGIEVSWR